jgi:uncharacterized protein (TIGR04255 family)
MPLLDSKRFIYKKTPLDKVICQLRFHPILSIETEAPVEFNERICRLFPSIEEIIETQQTISGTFNFQNNNNNTIQNPISTITANKVYRFYTDDKDWILDLTRTSISLTAQKYNHWKKFNELLESAVVALKEIYNINTFTRMSLRYIDIFKRTILDLKDIPWKDLISAPVLGILASEFGENKISNYSSNFTILFETNTQALVKTMLIKDVKTEELCFLLDIDSFSSHITNISDRSKVLEDLHNHSKEILRLSIQDKLHDAMQPEEIK